MMEELRSIREAVQPQEILLVVDAMTGQDAVNVAEQFHNQLGLTGVVLTKLDGDTRGGAALSVKAVTDCPIKFVGTGEKMEALEPFYPDRMASRILGMGDVLTLIEKAQAAVDEERAKELERKMRTQQFTFDDFLEQLQQVRNMGPLDEILGMIPGLSQAKELKNLQVDEKQLSRVEAIIRSMTPQEKQHPEILNASRRRRIARGSGTSIQEVNRLIKQFDNMKKMMKQFSTKGGKKKRKKRGLSLSLPLIPRFQEGGETDGRTHSPEAHGCQKNALLSGRGGRCPFAPGRPVHRRDRILQSADGSGPDQDRRGKSPQVAGDGRPTVRHGAEPVPQSGDFEEGPRSEEPEVIPVGP